LFAGTIGTKDTAVIQTIIDAPESDSRFIDLHISWPDGAAPPQFIQIQEPQQKKLSVQQFTGR
jgi:hypothetical protein